MTWATSGYKQWAVHTDVKAQSAFYKLALLTGRVAFGHRPGCRPVADQVGVDRRPDQTSLLIPTGPTWHIWQVQLCKPYPT